MTMILCMMLVSLSGPYFTVVMSTGVRTSHNTSLILKLSDLSSMLLLDWFGAFSICIIDNVAQGPYIRFMVTMFKPFPFLFLQN